MDKNKSIRLIIEDATVKQLVLAFCISYNLSKQATCLYARCSWAYYEKMINIINFRKMVKLFNEIPPDPDSVSLDIQDRIFIDIGRLFYNLDEIAGRK